MSKAHHNQLYYDWWRQKYSRCLFCGAPGEQFHHFQLVGAAAYSGTMPRRHSTYNAALLCHECHMALHDFGEKSVIKRALGGERQLYQIMMGRHHEFMDYLSGL